MQLKFALPLPRFVLHPLTAVIIGIVHVYLASGHLFKLVAGEVALSTLLLVVTGLLFRTLWNLEQSRLGFETAHITTFTAMPADAAGFSQMAVSEDTQNAPPSSRTASSVSNSL